ncbi:MAG: outer membrane lipoprotein carrier protein LolA [Bacteroidales bacterium]|nr:outer membrane lipoprotein carrier protein LolA [Bacteroidales bacterium]MCL2737937.1 outer membrane lipoprotein carrier protein LolA [Bacteroidales bacterium]
MKRALYIFGFVCAAGMAAAQQPNASQVMERLGAKMREPVAWELKFSFSGADTQGFVLGPLSGVMYIQGNDYAMLNPQAEVYVQGATKWMYSPEINEAIIMNHDPLSVDLTDNPFLLFSAKLSKDYSLLDKPGYYNDKGVEIIELSLVPTAKNAAYTTILLRVNSRTFMPHSLKYLFKDGTWYEALITACNPQKQGYPPEHFVFNEKNHPGIFISDLR